MSPVRAILLQSPGRKPWVNCFHTFIELPRSGTLSIAKGKCSRCCVPRSLSEDFSLRARKCANGCIAVPIPCRTIVTERLSTTRSLLGKFSIRLRI